MISDPVELQRLEQQRAFLASIVESCDDAVIGLSSAGEILSWNRGARQIYGYEARQVLGKSFALLLLPERREEAGQMMAALLKGRPMSHFETMHLRADGAVISVSMNLSPVADRTGTLIGASLISRDVTSRIRAEDQVRDAERKYRLVFNAVSDAIVLLDAESRRVIDFNAAALVLYRYGAEEFGGLGLEDFLADPNGDVEGWFQYSGVTRLPLATHRRRDGSTFPAEMSTSFFLWQGRSLVAAVVRDVTDRLKIERAKEIQQHLLPAAMPAVEGFEIFGRTRYCDQTGGDYFDFIPMENGRLGIALGDVCGHGIGPALLMAMAKGILWAEAEVFSEELQGLFGALNRHLVRNTGDDRFMTLFYGFLDPAGRSLSWISAAQGPVFHFMAATGQIEEFGTTGIPLGIDEGAIYAPVRETVFGAGDVLILGTDGLWEARNPAGQMFGMDRLRQVLATHAGKTPAEMYETVMHRLGDFLGGAAPEDDVSLLIVKAGP